VTPSTRPRRSLRLMTDPVATRDDLARRVELLEDRVTDLVRQISALTPDRPPEAAAGEPPARPTPVEPLFHGHVELRVGPVRRPATLRRIGDQLAAAAEVSDVHVAAVRAGTAQIELDLAGEVDLLALVRMAVGPGSAIEVAGSTLEVVLLDASA
jgi:hypothetical protein